MTGTVAGWKPIALGGFADHMGPLLAGRGEDGDWRYALRATETHANRAGRVHGGVLTALADQAMSLVAWEAAGRVPVLTVQFNASFVDAALPGDLLTAEARIDRRTRTLLFLSGRILTPRGPTLLVTGIWKPAPNEARERTT